MAQPDTINASASKNRNLPATEGLENCRQPTNTANSDFVVSMGIFLCRHLYNASPDLVPEIFIGMAPGGRDLKVAATNIKGRRARELASGAGDVKFRADGMKSK